MATIKLKTGSMAGKFRDILSYLQPASQAEENKYLNEIFLLGVQKTSDIVLGKKLAAVDLTTPASIPLDMVGGTSGDIGWLKRIKNFGTERLLYFNMTTPVSGEYRVFLKNDLKEKQPSATWIHPILIYQHPDKKIDHLLFLRVVEGTHELSQIEGTLYEVIMELQITPTGTQDSTYGNLYHLKHITFTFS